jgi:hypothetical protein
VATRRRSTRQRKKTYVYWLKQQACWKSL